MKLLVSLTAILLFAGIASAQQQAPRDWIAEWPATDFQKASVAFSEIRSGGPPKDGIPAIVDPRFEPLENGTARGWASELSPNESVVALEIGGDARAYPVRVLIWHEIVNDFVAGVPVAITYCPLCNSALTFRRTVEDRVLDFGTTGKLRYSDLIMYDRQTESWWQQFTGEAIVGELTGAELKLVPSQLVPFGDFAKRFPNGRVLVPTDPQSREYGRNPYVRYDAAGQTPFLYSGDLPDGIDPMERVVAIETSPGRFEAWALSLVRTEGEIRRDELLLRWQSGQASALDASTVAAGRDIGTVTVSRITNDGASEPVLFDTPFAFAFHAFRPDSPIHVGGQPSD